MEIFMMQQQHQCLLHIFFNVNSFEEFPAVHARPRSKNLRMLPSGLPDDIFSIQKSPFG
jgi:hypothetical protein